MCGGRYSPIPACFCLGVPVVVVVCVGGLYSRLRVGLWRTAVKYKPPSAAPNKRTKTVVNQQNRVFFFLKRRKNTRAKTHPNAKRELLRKHKEIPIQVSATPLPPPPFTTYPRWQLEAGTCAPRSRTVDRDRQLKATVRVGGGGSGRLSEPALCCSPCACDRPLFTERAGVVVRALARESFGFGRRQWVVILHLKLRAALGKGGSRCLPIVGYHSSAVTPAPLLPLCLAQRRYLFALDDAHWMDDAPPRRRPPRRRPAPLDEP